MWHEAALSTKRPQAFWNMRNGSQQSICGAGKSPNPSTGSAEACIEMCVGEEPAWEVSEKHSGNLELRLRLSPLYLPTPGPAPVSTESSLFSPVCLCPAVGSSKHFSCLGFLLLPQAIGNPSTPHLTPLQNLTPGFSPCFSQQLGDPLSFSRVHQAEALI